MSTVAIIGAGPMGLYLALKLRKAGVQDIVIYGGKHAGHYNRPGHINYDVFEFLQSFLKTQFWFTDNGHIKDVERALYKHVRAEKIPVEQKEFVRFKKNFQGIVLQNKKNKEELVKCRYVFDCTGSKRVLIKQINEIIEPPPFSIKPITDAISVKNHFLAYVQMSKRDLNVINSVNRSPKWFSYSASLFVKYMEQLRAFGWHEFDLPVCYGVNFNHGKVCLYLECPDNLPKESYESWIQTVINVSTNTTNLHFQQLRIKKSAKPRFMPFEVVPMEVEQVAYQAKRLPMVASVGDATIDSHYYLAHGVLDGMKRVDVMVDQIEVSDGDITGFDPQDYAASINKELEEHRGRIYYHYKERTDEFLKGLAMAERKYYMAIEESDNLEEIRKWQAIFIEIHARLSYWKAVKMIRAYHARTIARLGFGVSIELNDTKSLLTETTELVIESLDNLPKAMVEFRTQALLTLKERAHAWKKLGREYYKENNFIESIDACNRAIDILDYPLFKGKFLKDQLVIYSNMVMCYRKGNQADDAIQLAYELLAKYANESSHKKSMRKVLYNLIRTYDTLVRDALEEKDMVSANALGQIVVDLSKTHRTLMNESIRKITQKYLEFFNKEHSFRDSDLGFFSKRRPDKMPDLRFLNENLDFAPLHQGYD